MTYTKVKGACISLTARKKGPVYHLYQGKRGLYTTYIKVKGACISLTSK